MSSVAATGGERRRPASVSHSELGNEKNRHTVHKKNERQGLCKYQSMHAVKTHSGLPPHWLPAQSRDSPPAFRRIKKQTLWCVGGSAPHSVRRRGWRGSPVRMGQGPYVDRQRRSGGGRGPPPHATCRPLHRRRPWGRRWRGPRRPSRDRRGGPVGTPGEICARRRPPPRLWAPPPRRPSSLPTTPHGRRLWWDACRAGAALADTG